MNLCAPWVAGPIVTVVIESGKSMSSRNGLSMSTFILTDSYGMVIFRLDGA